MLHVVIMAGGAGTRFWPASRSRRPKQLLPLAGGGKTMIRATVERLGDLAPWERVLVVTGKTLAAPIAAELPELSEAAILGEPCRRDTAPCIGWAAAKLLQSDPDATMVVMPSDHVIQNHAAFQAAVSAAAELVSRRPQTLVTFGVPPKYAAESFGYIERGAPIPAPAGQSNALPTYQVKCFREKPSREVARQFLDAGGFYWNAGIFVWKAKTILAALAEFEPDMLAHLEAIVKAPVHASASVSPADVLEREFTAIKGASIDFAIMEKYADVAVIEAPFDWDDVGSWLSLTRLHPADENGNTVVGRHVSVRSSGCIVQGDQQRLIATIGLKDCLIVHTPDATLVANKNDEQAVREVVALIREHGWEEYL